LRRIRVGPYRVIYEVREGELAVLVVRVGHRREVYR
jgi:mRNA interferase RelE/StbE